MHTGLKAGLTVVRHPHLTQRGFTLVGLQPTQPGISSSCGFYGLVPAGQLRRRGLTLQHLPATP